MLHKDLFGSPFHWGVATAAYQIEGAHNIDGKGLSIWDKFSNTKGKILENQNGNIACDYYNRYESDIRLMKAMNIPNHRFSLSWSRILPQGTRAINEKGLDFYDRVIDFTLEQGIEPWVTLYHWDLPLALQEQGGWTNRDIIHWFSEYISVCLDRYGDRVKNWIVLNEPMVFTGAGYFLGVHAPGKRWMKNFLPAAHHATLCQSIGGRLVKQRLPQANVGTTFSCSWIEPYRPNKDKDQKAAIKVDALLNRLYVEPVLGLGYPTGDLPYLERIEKYMKDGDEALMPFEFDFIGIQNYTREKVKSSFLTPYIGAVLVPANKREVSERTLMNWEVYPPCIYNILKKYADYPNIKRLLVTENGSAFTDTVENGQVLDKQRTRYLQDHIEQVLKAKQEGVPVEGYFVWTFTDNFEWAEGYLPRFGLVHVDFETQERIVKSSGKWYADFLDT